MTNRILIFILIFVASCNAMQESGATLSLEEYKKLFISDCHRIKTIYEGHDSSGYYYENYQGGNRVNGVSLKQMVLWLSQCGAELNGIKKIME